MFNLDALQELRFAELQRIKHEFPPRARILEIGAGTGQQAFELKQDGFDVAAIDLPNSSYSSSRVFEITEYDGVTIPFGDGVFDVVFSSNVLEHVHDLSSMNAEIKRVLKSSGFCVHVMPTSAWRFWTTLTCAPALLQLAAAMRHRGAGEPEPAGPAQSEGAVAKLRRHFGRHGERGTVFSELWLFHPTWWTRLFRAAGYEIVNDEPIGIFYTGNALLGVSLPVPARRRLSRILGSACHLYKVRPLPPVSGRLDQ